MNIPPGALPASVKKEILALGDPKAPPPPYPPGSRIRFQFKTTSTDDEQVYDDSRKHTKPMELIIGKSFKIEVWEQALNTMMKGEVAKFVVPKELCTVYPMLSKVLRESQAGMTQSRSCCGHYAKGTGHSDLDDLVQTPKGLTFCFEIVEICLPGEYEKEAWYMTDDEKLTSIPELQTEGNKFFQQAEFSLAAAKYFEAISRLEQLITKEVPRSPELKELEAKKVPLLLNYALCLMKTKDFYQAIQHINSALDIDPKNVKGHFRRGQSHLGTKSFEDAKSDFSQALSLDPSLHKAVKEQLAEIELLEQEDKQSEKSRCLKMFSSE